MKNLIINLRLKNIYRGRTINRIIIEKKKYQHKKIDWDLRKVKFKYQSLKKIIIRVALNKRLFLT